MKKIKTLEDLLPEEMKNIAVDDKVGILKKELFTAEELKKARGEESKKRIINFRDGDREIDIFLKPSGVVVVRTEEKKMVEFYVSAKGYNGTRQRYSRGPIETTWVETEPGYWDKNTRTIEKSFIPTEDELIELAKKSGEAGLKALLEIWD